MQGVLESFWRACVTCLHPRVLLWSLLPLLLAGLLVGLTGWAFWEPAIDAVRAGLNAWTLSDAVFRWLNSVGAPQLRAMVAPMVVVALSVPMVLVKRCESGEASTSSPPGFRRCTTSSRNRRGLYRRSIRLAARIRSKPV